MLQQVPDHLDQAVSIDMFKPIPPTLLQLLIASSRMNRWDPAAQTLLLVQEGKMDGSAFLRLFWQEGTVWHQYAPFTFTTDEGRVVESVDEIRNGQGCMVVGKRRFVAQQVDKYQFVLVEA
ncbi:hypothetical protein HDU78_000159 [Chytriomyces hyalinus]|nr:hypothetical protein HDU78_000159 [Chytriomyces hyalinus]KAJ3265998.1 hypothetical protein HDU77_003089 [Chytriomyces hyalinus]